MNQRKELTNEDVDQGLVELSIFAMATNERGDYQLAEEVGKPAEFYDVSLHPTDERYWGTGSMDPIKELENLTREQANEALREIQEAFPCIQWSWVGEYHEKGKDDPHDFQRELLDGIASTDPEELKIRIQYGTRGMSKSAMQMAYVGHITGAIVNVVFMDDEALMLSKDAFKDADFAALEERYLVIPTKPIKKPKLDYSRRTNTPNNIFKGEGAFIKGFKRK